MNWGLGQGTQMKMNYELKSVSLALFIFSALASLISPLSLCPLAALRRIG